MFNTMKAVIPCLIWFLWTNAQANAAADDTRCPVSQAILDANFELQESNVQAEPTGTIVTCQYHSEAGGDLKRGVNFSALCPGGKAIRSPGYVLPDNGGYYVRSLVSVPTVVGGRTDVAVRNSSSVATATLIVFAYCD